jgi:vacuolar protein sorting-associated protein 13D
VQNYLLKEMFDKYAVDLNYMQVKDNSKGAHLKGNSSPHMVDRFSISLSVERTVETTDTAWPSDVISVTLQRLQSCISTRRRWSR